MRIYVERGPFVVSGKAKVPHGSPLSKQVGDLHLDSITSARAFVKRFVIGRAVQTEADVHDL